MVIWYNFTGCIDINNEHFIDSRQRNITFVHQNIRTILGESMDTQLFMSTSQGTLWS